MKFRFALAAAVCAALLIFSTAGFADSIKVDYNHQANWGNYHTYSWGAVRVSNQLNQDRIKRAVNHWLQKGGWKEVPSGGQITILATDNIHDEHEAETYYNNLGGGWGDGWGWGGWGWGDDDDGGFQQTTTSTVTVRKAHLVIDMFDARSKKLLWRGVSRGELTSNSSKNRARLYQDIDHMLRDFPPKAKH